jgi:hypothetical protein
MGTSKAKNGTGITIAAMMLVVALAAIGFVAVRYPTALAASAAFSIVFAALVAATVMAICRPGRSRAIWGSFSFCGFVYLYVSMIVGANGSEQFVGVPSLIIQPIFDIVHDMITRRPKGGIHSSPSGVDLWLDTTVSVFDTFPQQLIQIAHCFAGLAVATIGALFARYLTRVPTTTDGPSMISDQSTTSSRVTP